MGDGGCGQWNNVHALTLSITQWTRQVVEEDKETRWCVGNLHDKVPPPRSLGRSCLTKNYRICIVVNFRSA